METSTIKDLVLREEDVVSRAIGIHIKDQESFNDAAEFLKVIKAMRGEVDHSFDPGIKQAYATHKTICASKREHTERLDQAELVTKPKIGHWIQTKEEERLRLQRKADLDAQEKAEVDRLEEAAHLEKMGDSVGAYSLLDAPLEPLPQTVLPTIQKQEGIHLRETWKYDVENLALLVKAVAKGKVPLEAISYNSTFLNQQVNSLKGSLVGKYPGVHVWREDSVVASKGGTR